jgi:hypothetical protein
MAIMSSNMCLVSILRHCCVVIVTDISKMHVSDMQIITDLLKQLYSMLTLSVYHIFWKEHGSFVSVSYCYCCQVCGRQKVLESMLYVMCIEFLCSKTFFNSIYITVY